MNFSRFKNIDLNVDNKRKEKKSGNEVAVFIADCDTSFSRFSPLNILIETLKINK